MTGKIAAAIVVIIGCINVIALTWYMILATNPQSITATGAFVITLIIITFGTSAFSEKKK